MLVDVIHSTFPVSGPLVPGAHAHDAPMSTCRCGAINSRSIGPRFHPRPNVHDSVHALSTPYSRNLDLVQSLACLSPADPVSRGPMTSDKYSRSAATCPSSDPSSTIAWISLVSA